jgi:homoserine kinase
LEKITARSYSSTANLGSGFDSIALCHDFASDLVSVSINRGSDRPITIGSSGSPADPRLNSAGRSAIEFIRRYGIRDPIKIHIAKGIPVSSGLGGSGSSASATTECLSKLFKIDIPSSTKIEISGVGESDVPERQHFDNVAASLIGGLVILSAKTGFRTKRLRLSPLLRFMIALPESHEIPLKTEKMRELLPRQVKTSDVVSNIQAVSFLIAGLESGEEDLIRTGMNDYIFEPPRSTVLDYYYPVRETALKEGAWGACISGSGPAMMFIHPEGAEERLKKAVTRKFNSMGIPCIVKSVRESEGVRIEQY